MKATCSIDGCEKPSRKRGWCEMHYWRWRHHGTTDSTGIDTRPPEQRVDRSDPEACWLWPGTLQRGYGKASAGDKRYMAHRYFYELLVGPIPPGLELDHLCKVRNCVNPAHLEPVTTRENLARSNSLSSHAIRTGRCLRGHLFTEENTYRSPSKPNVRQCRTCIRARREKRRRSGSRNAA